MEQILKAIGARVRKARMAKGLSQAQLAEALKISPPHMSNIEMGKNAMTVTTLSQLCDILEVSCDYIVRSGNEGRQYTSEEFDTIFADCTPAESIALMNILQHTKSQLRDVKQADLSDN